MLTFRTFSEYKHSFFIKNERKKYDMKEKDKMCSLQDVKPDVHIMMVKLEDLHEFKNHPFKVEKNQELFNLRQSIQSEGILVPLLVRKKDGEDGYEIISGHRRKEAALWAGIEEVPVVNLIYYRKLFLRL